MRKNVRGFVSYLAVALVALLAEGAAGNDWPQWRGPNQDGISTETGLLQVWPPEGPPVLWRKSIGAAYSGISIVGERLYTMESEAKQEFVLCLDAKTGDRIWRAPSEGYFVQARNMAGPNATPLARDGRVYASGSTGTVQCLDAQSGKRVWMRNVLTGMEIKPPGWGFASSPVLVGGVIIVNPGGDGGRSVMALDKDTGDALWKALDHEATYSTPILVTVDGIEQLIYFMPTGPTGVSPRDGAELWHFPWLTENGANITTPLYHGHRLFFSAAYGQGSALVKLAATGGKMQVEKVWENKLFENWFNDPILIDGHLYGFHREFLKCVSFDTGEERWQPQRGFARGQLMSADGKLIVLGEQGLLGLIDPSPEGYKLLSSFQAMKGKCWTVPTVAHGAMYVRNQSEIVKFNLKP